MIILKGKYCIVQVLKDDFKIIKSFETKAEAESYGEQNGKNYSRSQGIVCLMWVSDDHKSQKLYKIYN